MDSNTSEAYPLDRRHSILVVVDVQESLIGIIPEGARLAARVRFLVRCAAVLGIPVIATTQNAARLGRTVDLVHDALPGSSATLDKKSFSAFRDDAFRAALEASGRSQVVVCGVETHICVAQTAIDLRQAGYTVTVAADAAGARSVERHKLGMERIRDLGVLPAAAEAVAYEWLGEAGTHEFRAVLPLVKELS